MISKSASPASFKASTLSPKLAIMCFWSQKLSLMVLKIFKELKLKHR